MGDVVLNDALGRFVELVDAGAEDLILIPLSAVDSDVNIVDAYAGGSFLDDVLGDAANTEQTGSNWSRKVISNASITVTVDDTADDVDVAFPDQTWTSVAVSNDAVALLLCIDGASDAARQVMCKYDFAVTTDGNDVTADVSATTGVWRST